VSALSTEATNFGWLLDNFVRTVPGTRHTLVVSADGLLMAMSDNLDRTSGDQLAAIVSGMSSLTRGASRQLNGGAVRQSIIERLCPRGCRGLDVRRRSDRLRDGDAGLSD
jgi:predicted regulator of Ras-like GTPase activity (Roadblock/LC7/MglB family)